ncbi:porphobilinogen synthase, partial [bacterium]|nr:porphobilinogen synthase [bacterium]
MSYPVTRLRRLRKNENIRRLIRETKVSVDDLIYPLFVCPGKGVKKEINSMPGVYQMSVDTVVEECKQVYDLRIPGIILFGIPEHKDSLGSEGYSDDGIIQKSVRAIKKEVPGLIVVTDACLCEYTDHGHCGVVSAGYVDNDKTLELLAKMAVSHTEAGADIIAPSDMMDGRVKRIRTALDENGFINTPILSYAVKYASAFYGPFREAAESTPQSGDRKSYQMDPPNTDEAMREIALDIEEGADIIMVKPALSYLDVIHRAKQRFNIPLAAYNVSGEYSMVKAASKMGYLNEKKIMMEMLVSIKRAGADII